MSGAAPEGEARARAEAAGLTDALSLDAVVARCQALWCVCTPPHPALFFSYSAACDEDFFFGAHLTRMWHATRTAALPIVILPTSDRCACSMLLQVLVYDTD